MPIQSDQLALMPQTNAIVTNSYGQCNLTRYLFLSVLFDIMWLGDSIFAGVKAPSCCQCFARAAFIEQSDHPLLNAMLNPGLHAPVIGPEVAGTKFAFGVEFVVMI